MHSRNQIFVILMLHYSVLQILNLIPKESDGERFEDALARVCRCVGGGGATEADSDSDLEVVADSFAVNLRCPVSCVMEFVKSKQSCILCNREEKSGKDIFCDDFSLFS